jgi:cysteine desulfurase
MAQMETIYFDHNATTPTRPEVVEAMAKCGLAAYANPASQHRPGQQARRVLEEARETIAEILDADLAPPRRDRLIFTSGGTEANNLAVLGISRANPSPRPLAGEGPGVRVGRIIISAGEHQSAIEPAEHLLEQGWRLDTLGLTTEGVVRADQLPPLLGDCPNFRGHRGEAVVDENGTVPLDGARLVSVQLGNHETGVLQPVAELAAICNQAGVPLHTDAVQVVGKLPVSFRGLGVAAMSISAHKFQGPPGIGALLLRDGVPLAPLMFGGHQQEGLRPGTEPVALAIGMATALELWRKEHEEHSRRLTALRDRFECGIRTALPNIVVHGATAERLPQTSNVAFPGHDGEMLRMALDLAGVACSVGSACSSGSTELSPTLRAMGLPNDLVKSSLRFSFGATTTEAEIDEAIGRIAHVCRELGSSQPG